jgi:hypothetical protein
VDIPEYQQLTLEQRQVTQEHHTPAAAAAAAAREACSSLIRTDESLRMSLHSSSIQQ